MEYCIKSHSGGSGSSHSSRDVVLLFLRSPQLADVKVGRRLRQVPVILLRSLHHSTVRDSFTRPTAKQAPLVVEQHENDRFIFLKNSIHSSPLQAPPWLLSVSLLLSILQYPLQKYALVQDLQGVYNVVKRSEASGSNVIGGQVEVNDGNGPYCGTLLREGSKSEVNAALNDLLSSTRTTRKRTIIADTQVYFKVEQSSSRNLFQAEKRAKKPSSTPTAATDDVCLEPKK